jgi:mannose/cellobiose epimerase-like protein (N-acyl-D-glucosamine 2-epimerase family)
MPERAAQQAGAEWTQARQAWQSWFLHSALPLWRERGVDLQSGGFHEKLNAQGQPLDEARRTRVVARQLYVFATAPQLGCTQDARPVLNHGLGFLLQHLLAERGTFHAAYSLPDARPNPHFDLYEQAFALFALGTLCQPQAPALSTPRAQLQAVAQRTLEQLQAGWAHPLIGFEETAPPSAPLRSNPHMHLLEAALCWQRATNGQNKAWNALVHQLIGLCLQHLVQPDSGLVTELFDLNWRPQPGTDGTLAEPGHQFEWGWLLLSWAKQEPTHPLAAQARQAAQRMIEQGEALGVDAARGVAINAIDTTGHVRDASAKLWPQTERIKAWVAMAQQAMRAPPGPAASTELTHALRQATAAVRGLMRYLQHPVAGAWHESLAPDGHWQVQDTRASSLYHIVCALEVACGLEAPEGAAQNTSASLSNGAEASFGANNTAC